MLDLIMVNLSLTTPGAKSFIHFVILLVCERERKKENVCVYVCVCGSELSGITRRLTAPVASYRKINTISHLIWSWAYYYTSQHSWPIDEKDFTWKKEISAFPPNVFASS